MKILNLFLLMVMIIFTTTYYDRFEELDYWLHWIFWWFFGAVAILYIMQGPLKANGGEQREDE